MDTHEHLLSILNSKNAHYHHNCASSYNEKKLKRYEKNDADSDGLHTTRSKRKTSTDLFPVQCIFCDEKEKDTSKMSKEQKKSHQLHAAGQFHSSSKKSNNEHVNKLTEHWREIASAIGDVTILSKLSRDVRANEIYYHSKCQKTFERKYQSSNEEAAKPRTVADIRYKKAIVLERTITILREQAYENAECPVEVRKIIDSYNEQLIKEKNRGSL